MIRPPLRSTLFLYTTLFRSIFKFSRVSAPTNKQRMHVIRVVCRDRGRSTSLFSGPYLSDEGSLDRKSTRLNSSHRCISYAVFCLKKKRKTHTTPHVITTNMK